MTCVALILTTALPCFSANSAKSGSSRLWACTRNENNPSQMASNQFFIMFLDP